LATFTPSDHDAFVLVALVGKHMYDIRPTTSRKVLAEMQVDRGSTLQQDIPRFDWFVTKLARDLTCMRILIIRLNPGPTRGWPAVER
jgi:hypothetical protein